MQKKISIITLLIIFISLLATMPMTLSAQDSDPTSIPILPESTEDSAAPTAPDIAPPVIPNNNNAESTVEPEATAVVDPDSDNNAPVELPINTEAVCPVAVQDSFTATEILCSDIASGEACIGNGTVDSVFGADVGASFSQANDRVQLTSLDQLTLTSGSTWTVIRAQIELATTDGGDVATGTLFAYGNLSLTDTGRVASGGAQNGTVIADRGMNVRRAPGNDGVVVWQLQGGQQISVTGISADREWIRMVIPNEFAGTGWVYAPYIQIDGGDETLPVVDTSSPAPDLTSPEFAPGQSFELVSALVPDNCDADTPVSGLLLQSPSGTPDALRLQINSAEIQVSGTVFIQAQAGEVLRISVLEGEATVLFNDAQATASVNERINVPLDNNLVVNGSPQSEPFDADELSTIPIRLLPRQIAFGLTPIDEADTDSTSVGTSDPIVCTLTAPDEVRNIRGGPSTEYPIVQVLDPNQSVSAVGQANGQLNLTWYQTATSGWLRIDTVDVSGDCSSLPTVEAPPLPEPTPESDTSSDDDDSDDDSASTLSSSTLADLTCDGTSITGSTSSDGTDTSVAIGGTWTVSAGTTVTFTTQGGLLRPEFGDLIKLIANDDTEIAGSGEGRSLMLTFEADTMFEARFSAANGDVVLDGSKLPIIQLI